MIIAGAGASGLMLAYFLPVTTRVLLVDKEKKTANDRTWSFWEAQTNPFESIVFKQWQTIFFHAEGFSKQFDITPYVYKMIRSADFYAFIQAELAKRPNVQFEYGQIESLESDTLEARVQVNGKLFRAPWSCNSAFRPEPQAGFHHLLQHFKGYIIKTNQDTFDSSSATFMDFRIPQNNETQFVYVLPFDARTALVEYTLFSSTLLADGEYDASLKHYLRHFLYLEPNDYTILESEFGIIPMTDAPFPRLHSPRVMNIGVAGGRAKPSTGYAFLRILRQTQAIAAHWQATQSPLYPEPMFDRHAWMDSVYLQVLEQKRQGGAAFFSQLFQKNPAPTVLKFLDENSSLLEDLRLMSSVNIPVFTKSAFEISYQIARRSLMRIAPSTTR